MRASSLTSPPPASVSAEAAALLNRIAAALDAVPPRAPPSSAADFAERAEEAARWAEQISAAPVAALEPTVETREAGGVRVLSVTPRGGARHAAPLVYVHGGGFVSGSARANLLTAAIAADSAGRIVHSVDYTLAPAACYRAIVGEVAAAWRALVPPGTPAGLFGDSAGGFIAAASTLALDAAGAPLPSALALLSPVVDLAGGGDSNITLAAVDYLDMAVLGPAVRAYADEADWRDPLASPLYGDLARFPPTLIQVGTRELLLSDAIRFHRALRAAGRASRIEPYDGMPHVFQPLLAVTPEGQAAWAEMAAFWDEHLP